MKTQIGILTKLQPSENMHLKDIHTGDIYEGEIYLGKYDSANNYVEISQEEYQKYLEEKIKGSANE